LGGARLRQGDPRAGLTLGLGDFAGGHFLGNFGPHRLAFFAAAKGRQVEPFMRFDQVDRHVAGAAAIGDAQIETGLCRSAGRPRHAALD